MPEVKRKRKPALTVRNTLPCRFCGGRGDGHFLTCKTLRLHTSLSRALGPWQPDYGPVES